MITPAQRLNAVEEYYFSAKLRQIATLQAAGHPVLNLGIGSPDLPPHPSVLAALHSAADGATAHGYQPSTGIGALRDAWASWYARHYTVALDSATHILPLMGSKEGILHLAMAFLEPGDIALVPDPGYPTYAAATRLAGATVRSYALDGEAGWEPDFEALEASDLRGVKVLWANYPHMPTGAAGSAEVLQRLVDFGKKHHILIVHDNPYSFILNKTPRSILSAKGAETVALELNSLSKSHNLAGWRVGMLAGHPDYLKMVLRFKSNMDSGQWLPIQRGVIAALQLSEDWYTALYDRYAERQKAGYALMHALGCICASGQQGMFLWARIPDNWESGHALSDALLAESHLFLTPGGIFGSQGARYLRLSLCSPVATLAAAAERVAAFSQNNLKSATSCTSQS